MPTYDPDAQRNRKVAPEAAPASGSQATLRVGIGGPKKHRKVLSAPVPEMESEEVEETISHGSAASRPKKIEIRKTFPETWLFESFDFDSR